MSNQANKKKSDTANDQNDGWADMPSSEDESTKNSTTTSSKVQQENLNVKKEGLKDILSDNKPQNKNNNNKKPNNNQNKNQTNKNQSQAPMFTNSKVKENPTLTTSTPITATKEAPPQFKGSIITDNVNPTTKYDKTPVNVEDKKEEDLQKPEFKTKEGKIVDLGIEQDVS